MATPTNNAPPPPAAEDKAPPAAAEKPAPEAQDGPPPDQASGEMAVDVFSTALDLGMRMGMSADITEITVRVDPQSGQVTLHSTDTSGKVFDGTIEAKDILAELNGDTEDTQDPDSQSAPDMEKEMAGKGPPPASK